jgi:hypothetical protein
MGKGEVVSDFRSLQDFGSPGCQTTGLYRKYGKGWKEKERGVVQSIRFLEKKRTENE